MREEVQDVGTLIFGHRTQGRDLYMLERGEITVQRTTTYGTFALGAVEPGDFFGEASFITGQERSSDALAAAPSQLFRIDAAILDNLMESSPEIGVQIYWTLWHSLARKLRATNDQLKSFFSNESMPENFLRLRQQAAGVPSNVQVEPSDKIRLFREQGLSRRELMTLATFSREKRFGAGASLFQEGDEGSEMYIILDGRVMISKFIPGAGEEALAILERGDFFGEMSLIDGEPRSADARSHGGPLTVLALDQGTVREVPRHGPPRRPRIPPAPLPSGRQPPARDRREGHRLAHHVRREERERLGVRACATESSVVDRRACRDVPSPSTTPFGRPRGRRDVSDEGLVAAESKSFLAGEARSQPSSWFDPSRAVAEGAE